jgi:hypothetical protein
MDAIIGVMHQMQSAMAIKGQMSPMSMNKSQGVQKNAGEMLAGLVETAPKMEQAFAKVVQEPAKSPGLGDRLDVFA